jgi:hypothetical protein
VRFATDFWRSKTTWLALGAVCYALADVAAKGELTWQSALVALIGALAATIRDTIARQSETASLDLDLAARTLQAAAGASVTTQKLAEAMLATTAPQPEPRVRHFSQATAATEPDGEADRDEVSP